MTSFSSRPHIENCTDCDQRSLRLFCNLNQEALRSFDQIGTHFTVPARTILFEESQQANGVFVICSGQVKLSTTSKEGRTMILRIAGPGDVLGLSATLNNIAHEVTAESIGPSALKSVHRQEFLHFLEEHAEVGEKAARSLAKEYHEVFLDARRLAISGSAAGRLAQLLVEWANTAACGKPELRFTMALTHEELGNMAGTSRETVTRLLNQFERDQLIVRRGSSLTIINSPGLSKLAG
ncbi:transcriptional regulator, Crp/Fnr family [Acidisarcina polymorpha]|uniref:Transcriptional regulator, Crp/Fnr family n=1 Tax=Acidisarcina polymorpha TaxID=2211140 RepID=A0A2Z5G7E4_9BACT|nr:Crp/Fnr family transcriptional regulator [Acidisarcina polymorpha]AXC14476.1 transcriptional regulator, Crp/Fnr family [Acidisarcina polymorpha]